MERARRSSLGRKAPAGQKAGPWRGNFTIRQATQHQKRATWKAFPRGAWLLRFPNPTATLSLFIEQVDYVLCAEKLPPGGDHSLFLPGHHFADESQRAKLPSHRESRCRIKMVWKSSRTSRRSTQPCPFSQSVGSPRRAGRTRKESAKAADTRMVLKMVAFSRVTKTCVAKSCPRS